MVFQPASKSAYYKKSKLYNSTHSLTEDGSVKAFHRNGGGGGALVQEDQLPLILNDDYSQSHSSRGRRRSSDDFGSYVIEEKVLKSSPVVPCPFNGLLSSLACSDRSLHATTRMRSSFTDSTADMLTPVSSAPTSPTRRNSYQDESLLQLEDDLSTHVLSPAPEEYQITSKKLVSVSSKTVKFSNKTKQQVLPTPHTQQSPPKITRYHPPESTLPLPQVSPESDSSVPSIFCQSPMKMLSSIKRIHEPSPYLPPEELLLDSSASSVSEGESFSTEVLLQMVEGKVDRPTLLMRPQHGSYYRSNDHYDAKAANGTDQFYQNKSQEGSQKSIVSSNYSYSPSRMQRPSWEADVLKVRLTEDSLGRHEHKVRPSHRKPIVPDFAGDKLAKNVLKCKTHWEINQERKKAREMQQHPQLGHRSRNEHTSKKGTTNNSNMNKGKKKSKGSSSSNKGGGIISLSKLWDRSTSSKRADIGPQTTTKMEESSRAELLKQLELERQRSLRSAEMRRKEQKQQRRGGDSSSDRCEF